MKPPEGADSAFQGINVCYVCKTHISAEQAWIFLEATWKAYFFLSSLPFFAQKNSQSPLLGEPLLTRALLMVSRVLMRARLQTLPNFLLSPLHHQRPSPWPNAPHTHFWPYRNKDYLNLHQWLVPTPLSLEKKKNTCFSSAIPPVLAGDLIWIHPTPACSLIPLSPLTTSLSLLPPPPPG